jgi:hypothetical protein
MKLRVASLAVSLMLTNLAFAATPKPMSIDRSGSFLIDNATSEQIWKANTPAKVSKLYPTRKFRFVSEVTGGFNDAKICIVSARAMLLPVVFLPIQGSKIVYEPIKSATAFDAVPSLDKEQCQDLAKTKLKEAIQSVTSALAAT